MKAVSVTLAVAMILFGVSVSFSTQKNPLHELNEIMIELREGCQLELETFCEGASSKRGQYLVCLRAANSRDMLSDHCKKVYLDVRERLKTRIPIISNALYECKEDYAAYCDDIRLGSDRVLNCLKQQNEKVSMGCITAIQEAGW